MAELMTELRMVAFEVTRNCNLNCLHCRAAASRGPHEGELSTSECLALIDGIAQFARPVLIITGGEPLLRADIFELVRSSVDKSLTVVMAVNGTLLDEAAARKLREAGLKRVSISIDGKDEASHDALRQVEGSFRKAVAALGAAREAGLEFQLNTTVTRRNVGELDAILELGRRLRSDAHHMFFLVPTGRAREMGGQELSARQYEQALKKLATEKDRERVRVTCAPHYYRILRQHGMEEGKEARPGRHLAAAGRRGCLAGNAFCFISHVGDVQPCGYLEKKCGNIRRVSFEEIWKHSPVLQDLREPGRLKGKCGRCEFRKVCGGCRARAYEATGDYLEEEPCCVYEPRHSSADPAPVPPETGVLRGRRTRDG